MARLVNFEYSSFVVLWETGGAVLWEEIGGVGKVYSLTATFFVIDLLSLPPVYLCMYMC